MNPRVCLCLALLLAAVTPSRGLAEPAVTSIAADPATVRLSGPAARYSVLVHGKTAGGGLVDLTHAARFRAEDAAIAEVTAAGVVRPVKVVTAGCPATGKKRWRWRTCEKHRIDDRELRIWPGCC